MPSTRLIFVSGKGGTGKSAVTAATAIDYARRGHRVLAIDMAGRPGLASHLRTPLLTYSPAEVRPGLYAMTMNRSDALDEYLKLQLRIPQGAPTKQVSAVLSVLADTAPGVREIISIGKPIYETWRSTWDVVIVDATSLGQFQSYLRAPRTIAELVPTGNIRRQTAQLEDTLLDEEVTSIRFVCTPAELPVNETNEAIASMGDASFSSVPSVILNRMIPTSGLFRSDLVQLGDGAVRDAATLQIDLEEDQALWSDEIEHAATLPYLFGVLTPGEVAVQLADVIGSM